jgi:malonate-semialdehyde dehydrogenase (acetylating)/methylmalonate-semialdehyde dehydrogenase
MEYAKVKNFVNGHWIDSSSAEVIDVLNPATGEAISQVPLSTSAEVDEAVSAAQAAYPGWRETPPIERARYLFKLNNLLEAGFEDVSRTIVEENGKLINEARGSLRRGIECVEVATGIPSLMQGYCLEDVATGIDCDAIRQPMGVFAAITPFNFPAMVPLWFLPFAVACGNTFVAKPSEQTPLSALRVFELIEKAGFPPGVVNLVNGAKDAVDAILNNPLVQGVSFVGSSPVAHYVYSTAAANGKRVQALGGAKNFIVVMPDADIDKSVSALVDSCYGCAGERCLAGAIIVTVGDVHQEFLNEFVKAAKGLKLGYGLDESVGMGPVISKAHKEKVLSYIDKEIDEGADLVLDGRGASADGYPNGYFVGATVFDGVTLDMTIAREEIFGPVVSVMNVPDFDSAIDALTSSELGNATSIFTSSGKWAREFRYRAQASMMGINIGIAAPMAFFSFGGTKGSLYGDLKAHGRESVQFYTDTKVAITRWF